MSSQEKQELLVFVGASDTRELAAMARKINPVDSIIKNGSHHAVLEIDDRISSGESHLTVRVAGGFTHMCIREVISFCLSHPPEQIEEVRVDLRQIRSWDEYKVWPIGRHRKMLARERALKKSLGGSGNDSRLVITPEIR